MPRGTNLITDMLDRPALESAEEIILQPKYGVIGEICHGIAWSGALPIAVLSVRNRPELATENKVHPVQPHSAKTIQYNHSKHLLGATSKDENQDLCAVRSWRAGGQSDAAPVVTGLSGFRGVHIDAKDESFNSTCSHVASASRVTHL